MEPTITTQKNGQFRPGNQAAVGHSSKSQKLRASVLSAITQGDIRDITKELIRQAKAGDQGAAKLLLQYIGKPAEGPAIAIQNVIQQRTPDEARVSATDLIRKIQERRASGALPSPPPTGTLDPKSQSIVDRFRDARAADDD